jgi:hypothetical protein
MQNVCMLVVGLLSVNSDLMALLRGGTHIETVNMTKQNMLCRLLPDSLLQVCLAAQVLSRTVATAYNALQATQENCTAKF